MRFYKKHKWALGGVLLFAADLVVLKSGVGAWILNMVSKLGSGIGNGSSS